MRTLLRLVVMLTCGVLEEPCSRTLAFAVVGSGRRNLLRMENYWCEITTCHDWKGRRRPFMSVRMAVPVRDTVLTKVLAHHLSGVKGAQPRIT